MRVTISSSSRDNIDDLYKDESRKTLAFLAEDGCELNWGSGKFGIMGICYDEFDKKSRNIHGYTTSKYAFELDELPHAKHEIFDNTFDLKFDSTFELADRLIITIPENGQDKETIVNYGQTIEVPSTHQEKEGSES